MAIIHPKVRGFICTTTHPKGCELNVRDQIEATRKLGVREDGPKKVLVIGASSGYGLAARITAAFGFKADTLGVFFEKPGTETKAGTAGWYNAAAFDKFAKAEGLYSKSINGDAFSDEARAKVIELIKNEMGGKVDLVIYSLASPVRKLPQTGEVIRSALKPIGQPYKSTAIDTNKDTIIEASIEPATEQEIADTVTVMGGQDWQLWIDALAGANVLAEGARTVAFSYIGSDITWPIYWHGALGQAKQDLDETALRLNQKLAGEVKGGANVAVLKSVVTQASSAIPVVPLYVSLLFKIMKAKGTHEGCIEQIQRLFEKQMYNGNALDFDENGRVRIDDLEMSADVQKAVFDAWPHVTTETFDAHADFAGYQTDFMKNFGFGLAGIDYETPTEVERPIEDA